MEYVERRFYDSFNIYPKVQGLTPYDAYDMTQIMGGNGSAPTAGHPVCGLGNRCNGENNNALLVGCYYVYSKRNFTPHGEQIRLLAENCMLRSIRELADDDWVEGIGYISAHLEHSYG